MKLEKFFKVLVKVLGGKEELIFTDENRCKDYCKGRGEWGSDLDYKEIYILVDGNKTYDCNLISDDSLKTKIKKANVISKLSNEDLKILGY